MELVLGNLLAFLGFTLFSAGIVLMKSGSPWAKWPTRKDGQFRRALFVWSAGFALYNLALIPNAMAARILPAYILSAISGWEIIVIVLLSALLLKEKIHRSDMIFTVIIVASIFILNFVDKFKPIDQIDQAAFYILFSAPFILLLTALLPCIGIKLKAILFSVFSGCITGLSFIIMSIITKKYGFDILSYFSTPYPYLFMSSGAASLISLQLAMKWGDMMLVGPLQNSLTIIYPVICSYIIFGSNLNAIQIAAIIAIVLSCVAILRKH